MRQKANGTRAHRLGAEAKLAEACGNLRRTGMDESWKAGDMDRGAGDMDRGESSASATSFVEAPSSLVRRVSSPRSGRLRSVPSQTSMPRPAVRAAMYGAQGWGWRVCVCVGTPEVSHVVVRCRKRRATARHWQCCKYARCYESRLNVPITLPQSRAEAANAIIPAQLYSACMCVALVPVCCPVCWRA